MVLLARRLAHEQLSDFVRPTDPSSPAWSLTRYGNALATQQRAAQTHVKADAPWKEQFRLPIMDDCPTSDSPALAVSIYIGSNESVVRSVSGERTRLRQRRRRAPKDEEKSHDPWDSPPSFHCCTTTARCFRDRG